MRRYRKNNLICDKIVTKNFHVITFQDKLELRYNALNQITLWGPSGEISDYAAKQWAGNLWNT